MPHGERASRLANQHKDMGSRRWYGWPPRCREIKRLTRTKERQQARRICKNLLDIAQTGGTLDGDDTVRITMKPDELDDYERSDSVDLDAFLLHPEDLEPGWYDPPDSNEDDDDDDFWDRFDDALAAYDQEVGDFIESDPDDDYYDC